MKNSLVELIKIMALTAVIGLLSLLSLVILFQDQGNAGLLSSIIMLVLGGPIVFFHLIVVYIPIYLNNKKVFRLENKEIIFDRFLPFVLTPITCLFIIMLIINDSEIIMNSIIIANTYIIISFSFFQFINSIKQQEN